MATLTPKVAAELARDIYGVQNELLLKALLARHSFTKDAGGKKAVSAEVGSRLINTRDGFGICARGGKGFEKDVFIVFRGSTTANYMADWISNARIGVETSKTGLPVHIGFNSIFGSMLPQIREFLAKNMDASYTVHCIGHSLGGAVATLAADWIKSNTGNRVKLYTFGAPKPGFEFFSKKLTTKLGSGNIHRVYHSTDPVPMIPLYPFSHAPMPGKGHHIFSSDALMSADAHDMTKYVSSVGSFDWGQLNDPLPQSSQEKLVERWLQSERSLNPFNPKTWDWINAGLEYVLKKILKGAAVLMQSLFITGFTLADKIAWILKKGIDLSRESGSWVLRLMRKIMQVLGMAVVKTVKELTRLFMQRILTRLLDKINSEATRAVRNIS